MIVVDEGGNLDWVVGQILETCYKECKLGLLEELVTPWLNGLFVQLFDVPKPLVVQWS